MVRVASALALVLAVEAELDFEAVLGLLTVAAPGVSLATASAGPLVVVHLEGLLVVVHLEGLLVEFG